MIRFGESTFRLFRCSLVVVVFYLLLSDNPLMKSFLLYFFTNWASPHHCRCYKAIAPGIVAHTMAVCSIALKMLVNFLDKDLCCICQVFLTIPQEAIFPLCFRCLIFLSFLSPRWPGQRTKVLHHSGSFYSIG